MYNITDADSLGTDYTIADLKGTIIGSIQIVSSSEIIDAVNSPYFDDEVDMATYIAESREQLKRKSSIPSHLVLWHAVKDDEITLTEVIEYAVSHGYTKIILEHLVD